MRFEAKKMFNGYIDLRDYNVKRCIRKNEKYIVTYMDETMTLTPQDLEYKCVHRQPVESVKGKTPYELWSYKWIVD